MSGRFFKLKCRIAFLYTYSGRRLLKLTLGPARRQSYDRINRMGNVGEKKKTIIFKMKRNLIFSLVSSVINRIFVHMSTTHVLKFDIIV